MVAYHLGKGITEAQRSRWAQLICQADDLPRRIVSGEAEDDPLTV